MIHFTKMHCNEAIDEQEENNQHIQGAAAVNAEQFNKSVQFSIPLLVSLCMTKRTS